MERIVKKINENEITNSKDVRKLRLVLHDPVARDEFLNRGTLDTALLKVAPQQKTRQKGLMGDLDELGESIRRYPCDLPGFFGPVIIGDGALLKGPQC